jgi:hypothetical protein
MVKFSADKHTGLEKNTNSQEITINIDGYIKFDE